MPISAHIIFQQNGDSNLTPGSRDDLVLSLPITILNQNDSGITSWLWVMIDKPSGSSASLVSNTSSTTTFTPDIEGTYLIKLLVNAGAATDQKGAGIKTANLHYRIPAALETTEFDTIRGWATAVNFALEVLDDGYNAPISTNLEDVYDNTNPAYITLNSTNGTLIVRDNPVSIGTELFKVAGYSLSTYFSVSPIQTNIVGILTQIAGKVGLGTQTPFSGYPINSDANVHIFKTGHNILLVDTSTASDSGVAFFTSSSNHASLFLDNSDNQKVKLAFGNVDTHSNRQSNTKITFQQDGSVGIGTTSPTALFDVNGTSLFSGAATFTSGFTSNANSSLGGFNITSLATPISGTDAVNKNYVDGLISGIILQSVYDNSIPASILLNSTNGAILINDAQSHLGVNRTTLFAIDAYSGSSSYLNVYREGIQTQNESGSTIIQLTGATSTTYLTIWGASDAYTYAGGYDPSGSKQQLAHFDGNSWTTLTTYPGAVGDTLSAIFGFSTSHLYIGAFSSIGGAGGIWHSANNGVSWTQQYSTKGINTIWGFNGTNIYAGVHDNSGQVLFSNGGGSWATVAGNVGSRFINSIWGASTTEFWVATSDSIYHTTNSGTTLTEQFNTSTNSSQFTALGFSVNWKSIWGTSASNIYAAGTHNGTGFIAHYNGSEWTLQLQNYPDPSNTGFYSIYGTNQHDIYVVGGQVVLYSLGDGSWQKQPLTILTGAITANSVWASSYNKWHVGLANDTNAEIASLAPNGGNIDAYGIITATHGIIGNRFASPDSGLNQANTITFTTFVDSNDYTPNTAFLFNTTQPINDGYAANHLAKFQNNYTDVFTIRSSGVIEIDGYAINPINAITGQALVYNGSAFVPSAIALTGYNIIQENGSSLIQRNIINFSTNFNVVDDSISKTHVDLSTTGITPGIYSTADVTVDAYGRITSIDSGVGGPVIQNNSDIQLTTINPINILSFLPITDGDYAVFTYYRIINSSINLHIQLLWTDNSGAQSLDILPNSLQAVGSYATAPVYINSTASQITVLATSNTANDGYVSASLINLATSGIGTTPPIQEKANVFDIQLVTTNPTNIFSFTAAYNGNYVIYTYCRIENSTTDVTITLTWIDNGGAQTMPIIGPIASKTTGSYSITPIYIQSISGNTITLSATSGTANNLFISATAILI